MTSTVTTESYAERRIAPLLTLDEVARTLSISRRGVRRRIDAGELAVVRIGRLVRVTASELHRFIDDLESLNDASPATTPGSASNQADITGRHGED